jgi:crossover junction endodeoxyribonuclease RuvC
MIFMGIDPGSVICGYGVIEKTGNSTFRVLEFGVVEAKKRFDSMPQRLSMIYEELIAVIERTLPDEISLEATFYAKNAQSLIKLSHARGVAMLAGNQRSIPVIEYSAKEVKRAVTGNGNASKEQVGFMVKSLLNIEEESKFFDATDALAVALCHGMKRSAPKQSAKSWMQFIQENPGRIKR